MSRAQRILSLATVLAASSAAAQQTTLESVSTQGTPISKDCFSAGISGDGRIVAWTSADPNVVPGDTNGAQDVFVRDRVTGITTRVSVSTSGVEGDGASRDPRLSYDGRFVVFSSMATNLAGTDGNGTVSDVFLRDRLLGTTERISASSAGVSGDGLSYKPQISSDGRFVLFASEAKNLIPTDTNDSLDFFVRDRQTGMTEGITQQFGGVFQSAGVAIGSMSDDARYFALRINLPSQVGLTPSIALFDRQLGTTTPLAVGPLGTMFAEWPVISSDGSAVAFQTSGNLLPQDQNGNTQDIYVYDVASGALELGTRNVLNGSGGNGHSYPTRFSADGRFLVFSSGASNLVKGDQNGAFDAFVHDRATRKTTRVSLGANDQEGNGSSSAADSSADGKTVAFVSVAGNIVTNDTNGVNDCFVREITSQASFSAYGVGFPGTGGMVPTLALLAPPVIGTSTSLSIGNSSGSATQGILLIGAAAASIPTPALGVQLVAAPIIVPLTIGANGTTFGLTVPDDISLSGLDIFFQAIELDPGATASVSFTPGLVIHPGD